MARILICSLLTVLPQFLAPMVCWGQTQPGMGDSPRIPIDGVFPELTVMAPGVGSDSETGIGGAHSLGRPALGRRLRRPYQGERDRAL